jgi:hypothetical protein
MALSNCKCSPFNRTLLVADNFFRPPPPCFCVCTGIIGLTGEFLGCTGMIGLSGYFGAGEGLGRSELAQEQRPLSITETV